MEHGLTCNDERLVSLSNRNVSDAEGTDHNRLHRNERVMALARLEMVKSTGMGRCHQRLNANAPTGQETICTCRWRVRKGPMAGKC